MERECRADGRELGGAALDLPDRRRARGWPAARVLAPAPTAHNCHVFKEIHIVSASVAQCVENGPSIPEAEVRSGSGPGPLLSTAAGGAFLGAEEERA